MNIVIIGSYAVSERMNGPQKFAKRLFESLQTRGHAVLFADHIRPGMTGPLRRWFGEERTGDSIRRFGTWRLAWMLLWSQPDVIHIASFERYVIAVFILKPFLRTRIIVTMHGDIRHETSGVPWSRSWKDRLAGRCMVRHADTVVSVSPQLSARLAALYGAGAAPMEVVPNGVDAAFGGDAVPLRAFDGPLSVVVRERLAFHLDRLPEAVAALRRHVKRPIRLFVIGEAGRLARPAGFEEDAGSSVDITAVAPMDAASLADFLADKHVVMNTAMYETFSIFTVECMACGLVPVVADTVGMCDYVHDGIDGFIVPHQDLDRFAGTVESLNQDRERLKEMSARTSAVMETLSWSMVAERYERVYVDRKVPS